MNDNELKEKVPAPPPNVDHSDLWYEVGVVSAKIDVLIDQLPEMNKRVSSLERTRTQAATIAGLFTTGVAGSIAVYSKKIMEFMNGV